MALLFSRAAIRTSFASGAHRQNKCRYRGAWRGGITRRIALGSYVNWFSVASRVDMVAGNLKHACDFRVTIEVTPTHIIRENPVIPAQNSPLFNPKIV